MLGSTMTPDLLYTIQDDIQYMDNSYICEILSNCCVIYAYLVSDIVMCAITVEMF